MTETVRADTTLKPVQASLAPGEPLSFSEEFVWRMARGGAEPVAFIECPVNMSIVVGLRNELDVHALRRSLDEIVRRHAVLRSRFEVAAGQPVRVTAPPGRVLMSEIDLRQLSEPDPTRTAHELVTLSINEPFDLAAGQLLRAVLVRLHDDVHILAVTVHHIVFDGESRRVFVRELASLYGAYAEGREPALPAPRASYSDYVSWQRGRLTGDVRHRLTNAWAARLSSCGELRLSSDRPRGERRPGSSSACRFSFTRGEVEALRSLSRSSGASVAMTLLAVFGAFLRSAAGASEVTVGMPISDRRRVEFEEAIGLFTNVLVLRLDLSGGPAFTDLVKRVRRELGEAYAQQDLPYGCYVQARAEATGQPQRSPFRVVFNFLNGASESRLQIPGLEVEDVALGYPLPGLVDLTLQVWDKGHTLSCALSYNAALFSAEQVARFADQLKWWARAVVATPRRPLDDLAADAIPAGTTPI